MNETLNTIDSNATGRPCQASYINYSQAAKVLLYRKQTTPPTEKQINTLAVMIRRKFSGTTPVPGKQGGRFILTEELIPLLLQPKFKGKIRRDVLINSIRKASCTLEIPRG